MPAPADPLPRSLSHLRSTIDRLVPSGLPAPGRPGDTLPPSARPDAPTRIEQSQYAPEAIAAVPRGTTPVVRLPYPAVVYQAAAEVLKGHSCTSQTPLTVCIVTGPHVPGAGCETVRIADLLEQVAGALQ